MDQDCAHCGEKIRLFHYALGDQWMHIDEYASFPTTMKGTAWSACKAKTVATPKKEK